MNVRVKLFAILRDRAGTSELALELAEGATVLDAVGAIGEKLPAIAALLGRAATAVNRSYVPAGAVLCDGDELAIIPPVSGGSGPPPSCDLIAIVQTPLDLGAAARFVADPSAGGIDIFLGTTRNETGADGQPLLALDYESYTEMAEQQLRDLARAARERFPIVKLAMLHRTGRVALAEASVIIAVSCPHRGEAFDACRFLIDALKKDVAIWKKEIWSDGSGTWVHPRKTP
jgi:molybdopterin synthase catalytic subunit